ncbi:BTB/POZ domain-containing protein 9 [Onthophagus taurus]|uniref:BTB/POZ domain-containing protein 9 n=1 Tax=Onthophagus taurus TaxID=166361 RepID=UPI000C207BDB|nr:BTB/POZ domain-containing protein 9 [Onthophagus taurus]
MSSNSSNHQFLQQTSTQETRRFGDIKHCTQLSEHFGTLCTSQEYSDIVLVVEGQKLYAHKMILAARSEYFRALLYGGMKESSQSVITLADAPLKAFKILLKYIYSGQMFVMALKEDVILDILGLAHLYGFQDLETSISDILRQLLVLKNVCAILDAARLYGLEQLVKVCHNFMDEFASDLLQHDTFLQLSQGSLVELLKRNSYFAPEVEIFKGVAQWCKVNEDVDNLVINCIRLPLITVTDLLSVVRPTGLVPSDTILDAIAERNNSRLCNLPHRGRMVVDENVASAKYGAKVVTGEQLEYLLDGNTSKYDMEQGYTRHAINGARDEGIIVKLGIPYIINHIRVLLWDKDLRSYSYYIEVSLEQKDWVRVVDYSNYLCRSWQDLYFDSRVVQFIKIVGTNNTVNRVFHLVALEAMYKLKIPKMQKDIIIPTYNIATVQKGAVVIEGVSRSRHTLLDGDTKHYDWDRGYTCHQLGSGAILIQLAQPYILSSLRLLLWDLDDRSYSYYIESSVNIWDWEVMIDKTRENCQSWQVVKFPPRPVVYIRIVGTRNSENEVFHCVHFECPSCDKEDTTVQRTKGVCNFWEDENRVDREPTETATEAEEEVPAEFPN